MKIFCKKWHIHFLAPSRHDYFVNLYVLSDKNEKFNKFIIKILYMSFFFCTFAAAIYVRIGARRYVYDKERKNNSGISCISRRKNGVRISASECRGTDGNGCRL